MTSMPPAGFEPSMLASERLQTQAFERAATGIGLVFLQDISLYELRVSTLS